MIYPFLETLTTLAKKETGIAAREFQQAVMEAMKDGKLTKEEIDTLETEREALGLPIEVLNAIRIQAYVVAFQSAVKDTDITDTEWDELEHIQDYLGLQDREIQKTKKQLYRLRVLSELKKGNVPVIDTPHLILHTNETAHWVEPMTLDTFGDHNDSGELILTTERIVFRGHKKTTVLPLSQVVDAQGKGDSLQIDANKHQPLHLRYKEKENSPILEDILYKVLEMAQK